MTQLTIPARTAGVTSPAGARRSMRTERLVSLRSALPVGLLTLRHDIPQQLNHDDITPEKFTVATPKVDSAAGNEPVAVETPAGKGGEAPW